MKIQSTSTRRQHGMAVIVMLALLSIMLAGIAANMRSLNQLDRELKLLEQKQTRRLAGTGAVHSATNRSPVATPHP